jgi:hypothetical protein
MLTHRIRSTNIGAVTAIDRTVHALAVAPSASFDLALGVSGSECRSREGSGMDGVGFAMAHVGLLSFGYRVGA